MSTATLSPAELRDVHSAVIGGREVEPEERAEMCNAYDAARRSPANRALGVICKKLEEVARLMDDWTDHHANGKCDCQWCMLYGDDEGEFVYRTLIAGQYNAEMALDIVEGNMLGSPDSILADDEPSYVTAAE